MTVGKRPWAALVGALIAWSSAAPSVPAQAPSATQIVVHADERGPKIDRNIFGQFAEHLGTGIYGGVWVGEDSRIPNVRGIRTDVVAALRAIKVPNVRWPGGCFADEYHWRDGIGPAAKRRVTVNANWGGVIEPNSFGTHEFMDFVSQIGSEAYVSVNVGSGTPQEAADWIEYMTAVQPTTLARERAANGHPSPFKVKYLGVGNENWGCGGAMSPDYYVSQLKIYSRYVRNLDPAQTGAEAMQKIAVGPDGAGVEYTEAVMKAWRDKIWSWDFNGLSLHSYTVGGWPPSYASTGFGATEYARLIKETLGMEGLVAKHSAIMNRYDPAKRVALVVDEWGAWLAPLPGSTPGFLRQQNSQRDAILAALNINIFVRHADRVRMSNIAQMVNVLQAMILTDNEKMVLTPTYHVFKMYVPFQDAVSIPVSFSAGVYTRAGANTRDDIELPRIDAIAARGLDGKIWIAVTNIDPEQPAELDVTVVGATARLAVGQVLAAPRVDAINDFATPTTVAPKAFSASTRNRLVLTAPPASVMVFSLEL